MRDPHDLDGQRGAYQPGFRFFGENERSLHWYAERVGALARRTPGGSVVSLGIGHGIVLRHLAKLLEAGTIGRYLVVEGSGAAIAELRTALDLPANLGLVESWFERFESSERFDLVEMGFVLEHVDDPALVLRRFRDRLTPTGRIAVAVPNARSLHRLIGHEAGLLSDLYRLSAEDQQLGHQRYFDLSSLRRLLEDAGLTVVVVDVSRF